jgi:hypothetical protein
VAQRVGPAASWRSKILQLRAAACSHSRCAAMRGEQTQNVRRGTHTANQSMTCGTSMSRDACVQTKDYRCSVLWGKTTKTTRPCSFYNWNAFVAPPHPPSSARPAGCRLPSQRERASFSARLFRLSPHENESSASPFPLPYGAGPHRHTHCIEAGIGRRFQWSALYDAELE